LLGKLQAFLVWSMKHYHVRQIFWKICMFKFDVARSASMFFKKSIYLFILYLNLMFKCFILHYYNFSVNIYLKSEPKIAYKKSFIPSCTVYSISLQPSSDATAYQGNKIHIHDYIVSDLFRNTFNKSTF
jgi:hypothetical protein